MHIEQQLRNLTAYLQSVREEEKTSIAREIHDDLGGMLTAMKIESYWLRTELSANNKETMAFLDHAQELSKLIDNATGVMQSVKISCNKPHVINLRPADPQAALNCRNIFRIPAVSSSLHLASCQTNADNEFL